MMTVRIGVMVIVRGSSFILTCILMRLRIIPGTGLMVVVMDMMMMMMVVSSRCFVCLV